MRLQIADELLMSDRSPAWLADKFGIRSNLLAHHVNLMVAAGLVTRHASEADGRRTYLSLTPIGRAALGGAQIPAHKILFVCTHNSARSQFAQALWRDRSDLPVASAGTEPAERIHPTAVAVAASHGVELTGAPAALRNEDLEGALVVSVCDNADESLAGEHLHWSVPDPARTGRRADFRAAYTEIEQRVSTLANYVKEST